MKRLKEEVSLVGKLEEISMMELRSSPGDILNQVILGKTFIIKRNIQDMPKEVTPEEVLSALKKAGYKVETKKKK